MAEQHGKALVPEIRFSGFTDPWEQRKFGDGMDLLTGFPFESGKFSDNGINLIRGMNVKRGYLDLSDSLCMKWKSSEGLEKYLLEYEDILIQMDGALIGKSYAKIKESQLPALLVQRVTRARAIPEVSNSDFMYQTIQRDFFKYIILNKTDSAVPHLSLKDIREFPIRVPNLEEQKKIGEYLSNLDNLITLHQRKYDKLCVLKKSMLDKMFPKGGSLYPEIRFSGFTDPWEQRKLSELVEIERGGSPRPIERYITDDPCGLNWVKIGDAPELGRYITQTAEKIKPEGLAKTRQVYPGDLVLSNSMSFGRPYIMAIKGCIHDGWLLIRDAQKHFDPIFLCHMLGAPQMLNQYRMFAAGSTVNNLNKELVGKAIVSLPSKDEQREIGIVLDRLDSLITLHQRKLELLRNIKKSMLDKMFV